MFSGAVRRQQRAPYAEMCCHLSLSYLAVAFAPDRSVRSHTGQVHGHARCGQLMADSRSGAASVVCTSATWRPRITNFPRGGFAQHNANCLGRKGVHTIWALEVQVHDVLRVQEGQPARNVQRDVLAQARQPMRCSVHPQAQFVKPEQPRGVGQMRWAGCQVGEAGT